MTWPDNPKAWLIQAASRRLIDEVRQAQARRRREERAALRELPPEDVEERDDTLQLLFLSCHPALTPASAIALTLRAVGGLTTAEIAIAYLVPEATMAQRISRAKQKLKGAAFEFDASEERLRSVLHVLYLMFNEGYMTSSGPDLQRSDLSSEAIRLTRAVRALLPDDGQVTGLLALMLLNDARRAARTGTAGELIPLMEQDRTLWNQDYITEGVALAVEAFGTPPLGESQLQAAIAALHDEVDRAEDTDWPQILALYGLLEDLSGNPMVRLNRAIAAAMVNGPDAGLKLLESLDEELAGHYRLDSVRRSPLRDAGRPRDRGAAFPCGSPTYDECAGARLPHQEGSRAPADQIGRRCPAADRVSSTASSAAADRSVHQRTSLPALASSSAPASAGPCGSWPSRSTCSASASRTDRSCT